MDLWDENYRKPIKTRVKTAVYLRAMGKCESCGVRLSSSKGHFHHTRSPNISPTAKTVQFLCPTCHRKYGHKIKVIKDDFGYEERAVKRRRVGTSKKPKTRRKAIRDEWTGDVIGYKTVKVKPKETTTKSKPKTRRKAIRDEWGDVIGYKTVKVKPKETTAKKKTRKKKKKTEDDWW